MVPTSPPGGQRTLDLFLRSLPQTRRCSPFLRGPGPSRARRPRARGSSAAAARSPRPTGRTSHRRSPSGSAAGKDRKSTVVRISPLSGQVRQGKGGSLNTPPPPTASGFSAVVLLPHGARSPCPMPRHSAVFLSLSSPRYEIREASRLRLRDRACLACRTCSGSLCWTEPRLAPTGSCAHCRAGQSVKRFSD